MPLTPPNQPYRTSPHQRVTRVTPSDDTWIPVVRMADDSWKDFYFTSMGFADDKLAGTAGANTAATGWTPGTESFGVPNPATPELTQPAGSHWRVGQDPQPVGAERHITLWKSGELEFVDTTGTSTAIYNVSTTGGIYDPVFSGIGLRLAAKASTSTAGVDIVPRMVYPPEIGPSNLRSLVWRQPEVAGVIQGTGGGTPVADQDTSIILGHYGYKNGLTYAGGGTYADRCWIGLGTKNLGATWERCCNIGVWPNSWVPASGQPLTFPASPRLQPFVEGSGDYSAEWTLEVPQENAYFPDGTPNVAILILGPGIWMPSWVPGGDGFSPFAGIHNNETPGSTCTSAVITNWQYRWVKSRGISP